MASKTVGASWNAVVGRFEWLGLEPGNRNDRIQRSVGKSLGRSDSVSTDFQSATPASERGFKSARRMVATSRCGLLKLKMMFRKAVSVMHRSMTAVASPAKTDSVVAGTASEFYRPADPRILQAMETATATLRHMQSKMQQDNRLLSECDFDALQQEEAALIQASGGTLAERVSTFQTKLAAAGESMKAIARLVELEVDITRLAGMHRIHSLSTNTAQWASLTAAVGSCKANRRLTLQEVAGVEAKLSAVREPYAAHLNRFFG